MSFQDRSSKVMIMDQSGAVRQLLTDVVRSHGFESVTGVGSVRDAVGFLEVEPVDWIIAPLMNNNEEGNILQIIQLISEQAVLKRTRVSLLLEEPEEKFLGRAFELGLLSWFEKPFNKETLQNALAHFIDIFEKSGWNETKVSAYYLRKYLSKYELWSQLFDFEKKLLNVFPGDLSILKNFIQPLFRMNMLDQAKSTLKQVLAIDPKSGNDLRSQVVELFGEDGEHILTQSEDAPSDVNLIGVSICVVVDPDETSRKLVIGALKKLGVSEVNEFENAEGAWQWMDLQKDVGLIFQEWRIPKISGPAFIQRVRKKFPCTPVITVSSLLKEGDTPLVHEMGVAAIVEKPVDPAFMIQTIVRVIREDRMPTQGQLLEDKIRKMLEVGRHEEALKLRDSYLQMQDLPEVRKTMIEAEFAYADGQYLRARDLAVEVLKVKSDSIIVLNFIGKCLMKLQDFSAALKCFKKAQNLSPMNLQRLCSIAEASNEVGDKVSADEALKEAHSIDEKAPAVLETEAGMEVTRGNTDRAQSLMEGMSNISEVISYLNNKAVAFAKSGLLDEAEDLYQQTLRSVPDKHLEYKAIVCYNLALNDAKRDRLDESLEHLKKAVSCGESRVSKKAKNLMKKIEEAKNSGRSINFNVAQVSKAARPSTGHKKTDEREGDGDLHDDRGELIAAIEINPGELCCYKIFIDTGPKDSEIFGMTANKIRFTSRDAVARDEAGGLEKMMRKGA